MGTTKTQFTEPRYIIQFPVRAILTKKMTSSYRKVENYPFLCSLILQFTGKLVDMQSNKTDHWPGTELLLNKHSSLSPSLNSTWYLWQLPHIISKKDSISCIRPSYSHQYLQILITSYLHLQFSAYHLSITHTINTGFPKYHQESHQFITSLDPYFLEDNREIPRSENEICHTVISYENVHNSQ